MKRVNNQYRIYRTPQLRVIVDLRLSGQISYPDFLTLRYAEIERQLLVIPTFEENYRQGQILQYRLEKELLMMTL